MKKLVFFFVIFLLTAGAFAQSNQKTIKMVTYFPVPYIIYKHLDVYGRCDVGILDTCNMSVGKDVVVAPFNVVTGRDSRLNTGKILVQRGNLQLDSATGGVLATSYIRIRPKETDTDAARGSLKFQHPLIISTLHSKLMDLSVANGTASINSLTLGKNKASLPSCSGGNKKAKWKKNIAIDGNLGTYLVCE